MTDEVRCFPRHMRTVGICMRGGREWAPKHGFDWATFVRDGYPASAFLATGDFYAVKVAEVALAERESQGVEQVRPEHHGL